MAPGVDTSKEKAEELAVRLPIKASSALVTIGKTKAFYSWFLLKTEYLYLFSLYG